MVNINEILARAAALREETALNSISPERAGGIMYDTLLALNELWLQQGAALVISKIYASVDAMEADTNPVSDISGKPLRTGQIVVIASEDEDNGSVYRYNGPDSPSWSLVGKIGNLEPVDSLDSDSTQLPLAAHQGKVLDGKISQLGQEVRGNEFALFNEGKLSAKIVENSYVNNLTGEFVSYNGWNRTDYINVRPFSKIRVTAVHQSDYGAIFDKNKERIAQFRLFDGTSEKEIPENGYYIAFSDRAEYMSSIVIEIDGYKLDGLLAKQPMLWNNFFVGADNTYSSVILKGLVPGHAYRLFLKDPYWNIDSVTSQDALLFRIASNNLQYTTPLFDISTNAPSNRQEYYDFIVPEDSEQIEIGGRATSGVIVYFTVEDIGTIKNYVEGRYLSQTAVEVIKDGWAVTDFIRIHQGSSITWKFSDGEKLPSACICFYKSNKTPIENSYWRANADGGERVISATDIQQYAPNAAYIRASYIPNTNAFIKNDNNLIWKQRETIDGILPLRQDIEALGFGLDPVTFENKFKMSAIAGIGAKVGEQANKNQDNYLVVVHTSDVHGDVERTKRLVDFVNAHSNIKGVITTGDMETSTWHDTGFEDTYGAYYNKVSVPMLLTIGNHEVIGATGSEITDNSNEAVGARYVTPFMSSIGAVQGGENKGYYYKDFTDYKIRFIVLNEYEIPRIPNSDNTQLKYALGTRYISQAQADWFIAILNSVQSGWSVVVCMHQIIDVLPMYDNEFKCAIPFQDYDISNRQGTIIQDIIDAYISRSTLTKSYVEGGADPNEVPTVVVSADFTNANGEFICYMNGHTHLDGIGQSSLATNKQVNLNITCGSSQKRSIAIYDDLYRADGTISQDAFNVIAFDTDRKEIRVLRIGANVTVDMRRRDYARVSYAQ